ncbi:TRAP transporter, 4TM/12TM fusion protein [Natrinema pellirubrum DSM 15624]|uniref:TRAP transporter, 4TM/12TM fusion protein n=1 Tax=Natrinema pellirubrum (strain DSM 15624 / CIP 106293 / JCM 10476 / NCIMB 786 / 157) TaxID=797303 RepID=L0JRR8_NATP1|nr:TRAP transporter fused permease subunit [Natrinema pellirubrum]AGB33292.1 TRAP transporter, 4TM/12TM fusion protein [Natrinema pellirubrum DSM 15624]ELY71659.1 TRAP transporter, 4TM/12TM fusion protein [Natrinema pellirubrum DSM 15624]
MASNSRLYRRVRQSIGRTGPLDVLNGIVYLLGIALTLLTIGYAIKIAFAIQIDLFAETDEYVNVFLGMGLALYYFDYARSQYDDSRSNDDGSSESSSANTTEHGASTGARRGLERVKSAYARIDPIIALALGVAAIGAVAYVHVNYTRLTESAHLLGYNSTDHLIGLLLITLAIDSTRRAFGNVIAAVAVLSIAYAHTAVGPNLPGLFYHTGMNVGTIAENGAISVSGVYDETLMRIGSTWVAIFIMFAGIAKAYGLMDFVLDIGRELGSSLRTGVVQIAVISSMVMGSITGSAAANTATTGSFTIPMMKDQGIRDDFAASIEAVASAGGQMLPPVMGVAAFLMADFTGVSYVEIVQAGTIPAALFYLSVFVAVHFTILKFDWVSRDLSPFDWRTLTSGLHFTVPLGVLLVTLIYLQYTPLSAGLYTILTIIGVMYVRNGIVGGFGIGDEDVTAEIVGERIRADSIGRSVVVTTKQTLDGLKRGGTEMAPLVGVLAAMGLIIELLEGTGLTQGIATTITGLSDGVSLFGLGSGLFIVLFLAMIASIMFGLGMPTPAAYVLVVVLVTPGIIGMGVPQITAHMFVFYFAMLSAITPPVAISVAVGSRIADSSFLRSCLQALKLGAPGFVIPYAFITNNSLIEWSQATLVAFPVVLAGTVGLIVATIGFDGARDLSAPVRALFIVAALGAMFGSIVHVAVQLVAAAAIVAALLHARYVVGYDLPNDTGTESGVDPTTLD